MERHSDVTVVRISLQKNRASEKRHVGQRKRKYLIASAGSWAKQSKKPQLLPCTRMFSQIFRCLLPWFFKGNLVANWEDFEVAPGLDKRTSKVRLATLRSLMGKDSLVNLNVQALMNVLENY